ncbi:MAG: alpha-amylase family glycosyl hydrolase, partial [Verrucomicrobiota bacterium]|nr:alpha-amylase family glycosyl hydrolase [Verrucomicrobiota bacterium]
TVSGLNANYTTSHLFVDEIAADSVSLGIVFNPNVANVDPATVQVFTNLNRRDLATLAYTDPNGLPTEEGISPPSGDLVGTDDLHYYKAYSMAASGEQYLYSLAAQKTGAYRLTARYRLQGSNTWNYYTSAGRRDHAIVVSPRDARNINLYELNTLNIDASGDQFTQRSTFADLHDNSKRFNLNYLKSLGCNYLWFQPIHPNGIDGRQTDPNTGQPFTVGSPYAVKNFFNVMALMGRDNTRAGAMSEFQGFVADADAAGVGVMLDAPYNHTSYDAELAPPGLDLFKPGANPTDEIRNQEARLFSHGDLFNVSNDNYCQRAATASDIAPAPDRNDFGKFGDTFDLFYGQYSALVCQNDADDDNYKNESDVFNYSDPQWNGIDFTVNGVANNITRNVWRYFASYIPYWLTQTGHSGVNSTSADGDAAARRALDRKGIDALRADFGQGLPPQCWEYIINVARSHKWNFVFMTESLDGGAVTYRSNRHFDILNENIVFPFKSASQTSDYRGIFDSRRAAYGQGLVLLNSTSHDEENYDDPFQALIRFGVSNTVDGAPLIFYGQELGVSRAFGYSHYESNFGKQIPHFKIFNDLGPILGNQTFGLRQLYPVYAAISSARQFSPALRSSNRYYLNQVGGSIQESIFSIAKYETLNGLPGNNDVVFGFVNLDRNNNQQGNFDLNQDVDHNGVNDYGILAGRTYDFKNVGAYLGSDPRRRDLFLNRKTGQQLLSGGLFVALNKVPTGDSDWSTAPYEAQYLKLYDVTAPSTSPGAPATANGFNYSLGT